MNTPIEFFFDFSSFAQRKNPWAMLEAFEQLAARRPQAPLHCVIKFKGGTDDHPGRRELDARLARLARLTLQANHLAAASSPVSSLRSSLLPYC